MNDSSDLILVRRLHFLESARYLERKKSIGIGLSIFLNSTLEGMRNGNLEFN